MLKKPRLTLVAWLIVLNGVILFQEATFNHLWCRKSNGRADIELAFMSTLCPCTDFHSHQAPISSFALPSPCRLIPQCRFCVDRLVFLPWLLREYRPGGCSLLFAGGKPQSQPGSFYRPLLPGLPLLTGSSPGPPVPGGLPGKPVTAASPPITGVFRC